jgi:hypothetical protein
VPPDQIIGHLIAEVIGAECLDGMRLHVEAALAGKPVERDAQIVHKSLGRRWIHIDCAVELHGGTVHHGRADVEDGDVGMEAGSSVATESDRAQAKKAGFAEHLTKPVDGGRLPRALDPAGSETAGASA